MVDGESLAGGRIMGNGFGVGVIDSEMKVKRLMHAHDSMYNVPLQLITGVSGEVTENGHGNNMNGAGVLGVVFGGMVTIYLSGARDVPQCRLKRRVRLVMLTVSCAVMVVNYG